jgi:cytochrome bd ubiquinol oxidase subunit II
MFGTLSYLALQQYWWIIISILGSALVFLLFVQGGQTLIYTIGKTETERTLLVNALGRKWEFTFTTLVTFGGAFFASFPLFYSTSFGGAYWVWMAILFCFIIQAIAYEYRSKPNNVLGKRTYEWFLYINGTLGTILLGAAVSTFFTGGDFTVSDLKSSRWETQWHGLEAVLNIQNVALGLAVYFLARIQALLYFMNAISHKEMFARSKKSLLLNAIPFVVFFLLFVGLLITKEGFAYSPQNKLVMMEKFKYLHNLIQMPLVSLIFVAGVLLVLFGIIHSLLKDSTKGIWFTGTGTVLTVFALFLLAGLNHTCYYPSTADGQSSLNIENSSSSQYTLKIMSYVSLFVPFVIAYIVLTWRAINKKDITEAEMKEEGHVY